MKRVRMKRNDLENVSKCFINRGERTAGCSVAKASEQRKDGTSQFAPELGWTGYTGSEVQKSHPGHRRLTQCNVQPWQMQPIGAKFDAKGCIGRVGGPPDISARSRKQRMERKTERQFRLAQFGFDK
jgi:hypothetical protein